MSSDPSLRPPSDHAAPSSSTIAPPAAPPPPPPVTTSLPSPGSLFKAITTCHPSAHAGTFQAVRLQLAEIIKSNEGEALLLEPVPLADGRGVWPIDAFDHHVYSLAGLYYLSAQLQAINLASTNIDLIAATYHKARAFLLEADRTQFGKLEASRVNILARCTLAFAKHLKCTKYIVQPLGSFLMTWKGPNTGSLTGVHQYFVEACVLSHQYEEALAIINEPIIDVSKSWYSLTYLDHLRYHYLAGIAFAALKRWSDAADVFEIVVSTPAVACSAFQISAYKKLVIVQLIKDGKTSSLPKYVSAAVTRAIKHHCSIYKSLADAFSLERKGARAVTISNSDRELFIKDKNNGLVNQLLSTQLSRQILHLTKTYASLSLADLARLLGLDDLASAEETERRLKREIHQMVSNSLLSATITSHASSSSTSSPSLSSPTLTFHPPTSTLPLSAELLPKLDALTRHAAAQATALWSKDREVGKSEKYLVKAAKEEREWALSGGGGGGGGVGGLGGIFGLGGGMVEEDLMDLGTESGGGGNGGMSGGGGGRKTYDDDF